MKAQKQNQTPEQPKDLFFGLKYIAYNRARITINDDDIDEESLVTFARWQICKVRNILWNDPVWDRYTNQEILIEFFTLKFDEDKKELDDFEAKLVSTKQADVDWFERMEAKFIQENSGTIKESNSQEEKAQEPIIPTDFEDKF